MISITKSIIITIFILLHSLLFCQKVFPIDIYNFENVEVENFGEVEIIKHNTLKVELLIDEDFRKLIDIESSNNSLKISSQRLINSYNYLPPAKVNTKIIIYTPTLPKINIHQLGTLAVYGFDEKDDLTMQIKSLGTFITNTSLNSILIDSQTIGNLNFKTNNINKLNVKSVSIGNIDISSKVKDLYIKTSSIGNIQFNSPIKFAKILFSSCISINLNSSIDDLFISGNSSVKEIVLAEVHNFKVEGKISERIINK